jgi:hypothetical protein
MSEDLEFKIVPTPAAPVSRSCLHRERSVLRGRITVALEVAGFGFDPKTPAQTRSGDEGSYTVYQLPYCPIAGTGQGLRPAIQVALNYAPDAPISGDARGRVFHHRGDEPSPRGAGDRLCRG